MKISSSLIIFLLIVFNVISFAQEDNHSSQIAYDLEHGVEVAHRTGLIPMTPAQRVLWEKNGHRVYAVHLNRLGWQRINNYRKKNKMPLLSEDEIHQNGSVVESVLGANTQTPSPQCVSCTNDEITLPDSVDNSTKIWFPVIGDQMQLGSCVAFSTTYYLLTFANAMEQNWTVGSDYTKIFSPRWTYNLINNGTDGGSNPTDALIVFQNFGAPSWAKFPYDGIDYTQWPTDALTWRSAIPQRIYDYFDYPDPIDDPTVQYSDSVQLIKQSLNDGFLVSFTTDITDYKKVNISYCDSSSCNPNNININNSYFGQWAVKEVAGNSVDHQMTIVGYDDNVWVDINGNGVVDPGEVGAFKVANQWGTQYGNGGFIWLSYDALKSYSSVANGPNINRGYAIHDPFTINIMTNGDGTPYSPTVVGQVSLSVAARNELTVSLVDVPEAGQPQSPSNLTNSYPWITGGALPFSGTIAIDISDGLVQGPQQFQLSLVTYYPNLNDKYTLSDYRLTDKNGATLASAIIPSQGQCEAPNVQGAVCPFTVDLNYTFSGLINPPPEPIGLYAQAGVGNVVLTWDWSTRAISYNIKRSNSLAGPYLTIASVDTQVLNYVGSTTYTDTNLVNGNTYYYEVSAVNTGGESLNSTPVSATVLGIPTAPTSLNVALTTTGVELSWTSSIGASSYSISRSLVSGGPYSIIEGTNASSTTSFLDSNVSSGNMYYYVVSAINSAGISSYSNEASIEVTSYSSPPVPTNLNAAYGNGQVILSWSASAGAVSYNVKRSNVSNGPFTNISTANMVTGINYTDNTVVNGNTYFYVVSSVNGEGESANSTIVNTTPFGPPSNLTGTAQVVGGHEQITLTWMASPGVTSYIINRSQVIDGPYTTISPQGSVSGLMYTDSTVNIGNTYYYTIVAVNTEGQSQNSSPIMIESPYYLINTTSGSNGSISPSGSVSVNSGASQTFTITANSGYGINQVLVDGISLALPYAPINSYSYTFSSVTKSHSISASFTQLTPFNQWKLQNFTPAQLANPSISGNTADPAGDKIPNLYKYAFNLNPFVAYSSAFQYYLLNNYFTIVYRQNLNATDVTIQIGATDSLFGPWSYNSFNLVRSPIDANTQLVTATDMVNSATVTSRFYQFAITLQGGQGPLSMSLVASPSNAYFSLAASAGAGGSISPSGVINVKSGASQTYTITPNTGYKINQVLDNGVAVTLTGNNYTLNNISISHTIAVNFSQITYFITASAGTGGSISPSGSVSVNSGASQTFKIIPNAGYKVSKVMVDGVAVSLSSNNTFIFKNVTKAHAITASFNPEIKASAGPGGRINPMGTLIITSGTNKTFMVMPRIGYAISKVLVDGNEVILTSNKSYTFSDVTQPHTITASFNPEIIATSNSGGTVSPSGIVNVKNGASQTFTFTPKTNYKINFVIVDGRIVKLSAKNTYTFISVVIPHKITANFINAR